MMDLYELLKKRINDKPYITKSKRIFYNEMKEAFQELILHGLSENNFFENNVFHGGTSIRIIYGSERYSEDLDFNMKKNDPDFSWMPIFEKLKEYTQKLGFILMLNEEDSTDNGYIKRLTINGKNMIDVIHNKGIVSNSLTKNSQRQNIEIRLETSFHNGRFNTEIKTLSFPTEYNVEVFNINCLFAGKLNAVLTRFRNKKLKDKETGEIIGEEKVYENKGRDWYDLIWYIKKGIEPDWRFLKEKLKDKGYWEGQEIDVDTNWLKEQIRLKMETLDYDSMNKELAKFLIEDDNFVLNKDIIEEYVNTMGKDRYQVN
jgi:hypothetical protein